MRKELTTAMSSVSKNILDEIEEITQSRSKFQLEKFVINQHDTEEMRYVQCLLEIDSLYYNAKLLSFDIQKKEIQIQRLLATNDEIDAIDAQIKMFEMDRVKNNALGIARELNHLIKIYHSFSKKYTRAEIEEAQPDYWDKRLKRQSVLEALSGSASQASNLEALRQMGVIEVGEHGIKEAGQTFILDTETSLDQIG